MRLVRTVGFSSGFGPGNGEHGAVKSLFGGQVSAHVANAMFASPAQQVGRAPLVPFLIMHGAVDRLVPVHQSQILFQKLKQSGTSVDLLFCRKADMAMAGSGAGMI